MEAFLEDKMTGVQHAFGIGINDRVNTAKEVALETFCYPTGAEASDLQLFVEGDLVCGEELLGGIEGVEAGCTLEVQLVVEQHLETLRACEKQLWEVPVWVAGWEDAFDHMRGPGVEDRFSSAHITLRADRGFVLAALGLGDDTPPRQEFLKHAHDSLKADREIVLAAVRQSPSALQHAHASLRADRGVVLSAVEACGDDSRSVLRTIFDCAHESLKADYDIVFAAVTKFPSMLQYAHDSLKANRDVVFAAVTNSPLALQHAHESLKSDRDVVLAAVELDPRTLQCADDTLRADRDLVLKAVAKHPATFQYAHESLRADRDLVLAVVGNSPSALQHADDSFKSDRDVVLAAIQACPPAEGMHLMFLRSFVFRHTHESLTADRDFALSAVQKSPKALAFLHDSLKGDPEILRAAAMPASPHPALPPAGAARRI
eukprot:TRINITY_DN11338_c0_g1_i1.p1 TRINITY_DN11338_c0_g1~~TRINITY_DN11338_c0_g1_i1.p1  ORF type:complete len:432 (+),score=94.02 TRINITY_DN11338_c0_g1_i1:45-1340(+)